MIAHLKGRLDSTGADHAVIDVGGIGYLVGASARTLAAIGPVGEACTLFTEMLVAEDFIRLVGFASAGERDWFRLLTGVQGVGARVALAILSAFEPTDLSRAVAAQDKAMVARANGVGPKLAERIVRELKDKVGVLGIGVHRRDARVPPPPRPPPGASADAVSALLNLGFRPAEAGTAVASAEGETGCRREPRRAGPARAAGRPQNSARDPAVSWPAYSRSAYRAGRRLRSSTASYVPIAMNQRAMELPAPDPGDLAATDSVCAPTNISEILPPMLSTSPERYPAAHRACRITRKLFAEHSRPSILPRVDPYPIDIISPVLVAS